MNHSTNGAARPDMGTPSRTAEKNLERLVKAISDKLGGKDVAVKAPAGEEFKHGGKFAVYGAIARHIGKAADADTARDAVENVLIDYTAEEQSEVRSKLTEPNIIPMNMACEVDSDATISIVTELSNANRFLERHGDDVRFIIETGGFIVWDGKRFRHDSKNHTRVRAMMAKSSQWIKHEAGQARDEKVEKALNSWAKRSENRSTINASADLLATRKRIWVEAASLDRNHDLLNCQNGTVDLRTGTLLSHNRSDLFTCITPGNYVPNATHPLWTDTITRFIPDPEIRDYVQRLVGYAATGHSSEKVFPIFWGGGNNGKGSIFETIAKHGLGTDYAVSISPDAIVNNGKQGQHAQERANIKFYAKRLALFEETADGDMLDAGAVKRLASGGDMLEARALWQESFNFNPTHSTFLMTNAEPRVNCFDLAMRTRIKFIHFGVQVEPDGKIRHQLDTDPEVHRAVLAWIVEGAVKYFQHGLTMEPQAVREATERYFKDQDAFGQFLSECFEIAQSGDARYYETKQDIFKRYEAWATEQGLKHPLSKISLGRELAKRGFLNAGNERNAFYYGLKLRLDF